MILIHFWAFQIIPHTFCLDSPLWFSVFQLYLHCSYELVRNLQGRVENAIGSLVDSKLESSVVEGDGHNTVAQITDDVLNSHE